MSVIFPWPLFSRQKVEYVKTLSRLISSSFYRHDKFFFFVQLGIYQKGENKCIVKNTRPKKDFLQKKIYVYMSVYIYQLNFDERSRCFEKESEENRRPT